LLLLHKNKFLIYDLPKSNSSIMTTPTRQQATRQLLNAAGIMPVVTVNSIKEAISIAEALYRGGLTAIEVTLRTEVAMASLSEIKKHVPQMVVGAGTVLNAAQAREAVDAGANFLVSPGTTPALASAFAEMTIPVVPGAATPSEIIALMAHGFDAVKLFPAASVGGVAMAKSLAGPFPNLVLCPTGGISETDAADYLSLPNVACVGGSWMVAANWIRQGEFHLVEASAKQCRQLIDRVNTKA
jgi:2-dehydro-3-deoxyphosphogluconate aldolase / (4S)-4-hydroxy-2-oxoglutarate aldolase